MAIFASVHAANHYFLVIQLFVLQPWAHTVGIQLTNKHSHHSHLYASCPRQVFSASLKMVLQPNTCLSLLLLALAGFSGGSEVKSRRQSIAIRPRACEPAVDAYDLLLTDDLRGDDGGGGGGGYPSNGDGDETLLYPTLASTTSTLPRTDTKKAFFLLGLVGAVADLDRRAFFVVVAVTNLYAMRFLKAYVRPTITKWMCCNTQLLDSSIARTIRSERTMRRPEVDTVWDLLKSKNKPTTTASERADPCEKWLDQCGR